MVKKERNKDDEILPLRDEVRDLLLQAIQDSRIAQERLDLILQTILLERSYIPADWTVDVASLRDNLLVLSKR